MQTSLIAGIEILLLAAFLVPAILFLVTQYKTLQIIKPENRTIAPGIVLLQLIPVVGLVAQFFIVTRISSSIVNEAGSGDPESLFGNSSVTAADAGSKPTLKIGIAYCVLLCIAIGMNLTLPGTAPSFALIGPVFSLAAMICWIAYWIDLSKYKRKLKNQFV